MTSTGTFLRDVPGADDGRTLVIAFPHGGGGAAAFRPWRTLLAPDCVLLPVHLPGREDRLHEPPCRRMSQLVAALAPVIGPLLDRRVVLWGHSIGACISVALISELAGRGYRPPRHAVLSGAGSPDRRNPLDMVHVRSDDQLRDRLRRYGGTPAEVLASPELLRLILPAVRADFELAETWPPPRTPLPVPLTILYGADDASVSRDQIDGWRAYSAWPPAIRAFTGGHFFIHEHAAEVAGIIRNLGDGHESDYGQRAGRA